MAFWIIIWILVLLCVILLSAMEIINGTIELRAKIIIALCFFILFTPIFVLSAHREARLFAMEFNAVELKAEQCETKGQEYYILGEVIKYNNTLRRYEKRISHLGILSPAYGVIKELSPIELEYFDYRKYYWD